jgi:hypothetical protein
MLNSVVPMGWLWEIAQQCRASLRSHSFYQLFDSWNQMIQYPAREAAYLSGVG